MNVCVPHELYRTPRLRQAARTLCASGGQCGGQSREDLKVANNSKFREYLQFNNLEVAPDTDLGKRYGIGKLL